MDAKEFYNHNKNFIPIIPKFPGNIHDDKALAIWAINESGMGWLELDLNFDLDSWKHEAKQASFFDHRGDLHPGWNSCCIHGIDIDKTKNWDQYDYTSENEVDYKWTEISNHTPIIKKFWEDFPYESYTRIRFMELKPGGIISPHSDAPIGSKVDLSKAGVPINIAIIHPDNCHMTLEGQGIVPWSEGKVIMLNVRYKHSFMNKSDQSRIHLIAHGHPGNRKDDFFKLIARSYRKAYELSKI